MKKYLSIFLLAALLVVQPAFATKIVDVTFNDSTLTDSRGNLTLGALKRVSDATYHDDGLLKNSFGDRENILLHSEDTSNWTGAGPWTQTVAVVAGETYLLSVHLSGPTITVVADTATITHTGGTTSATYGSPDWFTCTVSGDIEVETDTANPKGQLAALPSGNTIGSDLVDQETGTARTSGADTVVGKIYTIVTQNTLDFQTVGSANNTVGTYFICDTVHTLGVGDELLEITAPAKGEYNEFGMLGAELNTTADAAAPPGGTEANDVTALWNNGAAGDAMATFESEADPKHGTWSAHFVVNGATDYAYTDNITVAASTLYRVSFWYKLAVNDAQTYAKYSIGKNGDNDYFVSATNLTATAWTEVIEYVYSDTTTLTVEILNGGTDNDVDINVDSLSVRQVQTAWIPYGTNTIEIDPAVGSGGAFKIGYEDNTSGASLYFRDAKDLSANLTVDAWYEINIKLLASAGATTDLQVYDGASWVTVVDNIDESSLTSYTLYFKALSATSCQIRFSSLPAAGSIWIDDLTIKQIPDLALLSPSTYTPTAGSAVAIPAIPRIEDGSLRTEGEGVNLLDYSEDFSEWTEISLPSSPTADEDGPDGEINSAYTVTGNLAGDGISYSGVYGLAAGAKNTFTLYFKEGTTNGKPRARVYDDTAGAERALIVFEWVAGSLTVKTPTTGTADIEQIGTSDWWRAIVFTTNGIVAGASHTVTAFCDDESMIIFGANLLDDPYSTSYNFSDGCPTIRTTEAGATDGATGVSWTMSATVMNALKDGNKEGTMIVYWTPLYDYGDQPAANAGIVSVANSATSIMESFDDGNIKSTDSVPTTVARDADYARDAEHVVAVMWSDADNLLDIQEKSGGTWSARSTDALGPNAFDEDGKLLLAYGNEGPMKIDRILMFDEYFSETKLEAEPWIPKLPWVIFE